MKNYLEVQIDSTFRGQRVQLVNSTFNKVNFKKYK